jgi:hypothetical protein
MAHNDSHPPDLETEIDVPLVPVPEYTVELVVGVAGKVAPDDPKPEAVV